MLNKEIAPVPASPENRQAPPEGFSYQLFSSGRQREYVPTFRDGDTTSYLVGVTEEDQRWQTALDLVADEGAACRLLPSGDDNYSADERQFLRHLEQAGRQVEHQPYVHEQGSKEAIIFDPYSPKSLLDVMILTGNGSAEVRKARRDALHGESSVITDTLCCAARLAYLEDTEDAGAIVLQRAFDLEGVLDSKSMVKHLATKGFDDYVFNKLKSGIQAGIDPALIEETVHNTAQLQQQITSAWRSAIAVAKQHNTDISRRGIYTELHNVGGVLIPVPAILSTAWDTTSETLGYVDVTGLSHTLAEIYQDQGIRMSMLPETAALLDNELLTISKKLGLGLGGRGTLQRRCLTTFDEAGNPTIHLREDDLYRNRYGRATDESIFALLSCQGIAVDRVLANGKKVDMGKELAQKPVRVAVQELEAYRSKRWDSDIPIACLTRVSDREDALGVTWKVGYADSHDTLRKAEADEDRSVDEYTAIRLAGMSFRLRADYIGNDQDGSQQIVWLVEGNQGQFDTVLPMVRAMIEASEKTLGNKMNTLWGVDADSLQSHILFIDDASGSRTEYVLSAEKDREMATVAAKE